MKQISKRTRERLLYLLFGALAVVAVLLVASLIQSAGRAIERAEQRAAETAIKLFEMPFDRASELSLESGLVTAYSPDDVFLIIPVGALNKTTYIEMTPRNPGLYSAVGSSDWQRAIVVNLAARTQDGTQVEDIKFNRPADICFVLNNDRWTRYAQNPTSIQLEYFRKEGNQFYWTPLQTKVDNVRKMLCAEVDSLSMFALSEILPQQE